MNLLPQETLLLESDNKTLKLTTHRVRYEASAGGEMQIKSMMLEELASCAVTRTSQPILIVLAVVCLLIGGVVSAQNNQPPAIIAGVVIGLIFVALYFGTKQQFLALASAGTTIRVNAKGMKVETIRGFVDAIEGAKNDRYLLTAAHTLR
jgi:hypothetical protein